MPAVDINTRARLAILAAVAGTALLVVAMVQMTSERRTCARLCKAEGFADVRFTPKRRGDPAQCHCLTQDESSQSSRVPLGKKIPLPEE